jgi:diguanylate cyclase (GGDEF)-like protein
MATRATIDQIARLRHIIDAQRAINSAGLEEQQLFQTVTEQAQLLTSADGAVVEVLEGHEMVYRAVSGLASDSLGIRLKATSSLSGLCIRSGLPLWSTDTESDSRVDRAACRRLGIRSMVVVPLVKAERPIGVLKVMSRLPDRFSKADGELLQELSGFVTDSIAHALHHGRNSHDALHDPLTGLPNRQLLVECLEQACLNAEREKSALAVFMLDLDGFKAVNDSYGHAAGDKVLRLVARRLSEGTRSSDFVARLGGDEFVLVCENTSEMDALHIAERISSAVGSVAASRPEYAHLTVSVGLAWRDGDLRTPHDLLVAADESMYRVKRAGQAQ